VNHAVQRPCEVKKDYIAGGKPSVTSSSEKKKAGGKPVTCVSHYYRADTGAYSLYSKFPSYTSQLTGMNSI